MNSQQYEALGDREKVAVIMALEEKLIEAYQAEGMDRGDAQGAVEAIIMQLI